MHITNLRLGMGFMGKDNIDHLVTDEISFMSQIYSRSVGQISCKKSNQVAWLFVQDISIARRRKTDRRRGGP